MKLTLRQITNKQTKQKTNKQKKIGKKDSNEKLFASNFNFSASIILYLNSLLSGHLTESFNIRKSAIKALKHGLELHLLLYIFSLLLYMKTYLHVIPEFSIYQYLDLAKKKFITTVKKKLIFFLFDLNKMYSSNQYPNILLRCSYRDILARIFKCNS